MIVQACINGNRDRAFHSAVPVTCETIAADAKAVVTAGAAEVHLHVRNDEGRETLRPDRVEATIDAVRRACPGTLIGISTGEWIERNDAYRRECLRALSILPDHASVNYAEADAPGVVAALRDRGIAIEAGLATPNDAKRLIQMGTEGVLRILIEIENQDIAAARAEQAAIETVLTRLPVAKAILLHGFDATVWTFVDAAFARGYSTRVGFEDGRTLADGSVAESNVAIVRAALKRMLSHFGPVGSVRRQL
jgi:uncharacterized protein (DUF849 family)